MEGNININKEREERFFLTLFCTISCQQKLCRVVLCHVYVMFFCFSETQILYNKSLKLHILECLSLLRHR